MKIRMAKDMLRKKYIIKIVSCTGYNIDKYGFIVIDVLGDKRNITIKLE